MSRFSVVWENRNFSGAVRLPGVTYKVDRYAWSELGGPKTAKILAKGKAEDLWGLIDYLRRPVKIDDGEELVWWGFAGEINLNVGNQASLSLWDMWNKVAVAYEEIVAGAQRGTRKTTDWLSDSLSVAEYGIRELLESSSGRSQTQAEANRARILAASKMPKINFKPSNGPEVSAEIICRGWWDTLEWRYCSVPVSLAYAYETIGSLEYPLGNVGGAEMVAQAFDVLGTSVNAVAVEVVIKKTGGPTDDVKVAIFSNPDDLTPTTELASGTVSGAALTTGYNWVRVTFQSPVVLPPGTYFIVVDRSGSAGADCYSLLLDGNAGYDLGPFVVYTGAWVAGPTADMPFRIYSDDIIETSQQVYSMLTTYGQFFRSVDMRVASGLSTESYRSGDTDTLYEVENLLQMGTSNNLRMLATVDSSRRVIIYEEPPKSEAYQLRSDFSLRDTYGSFVKKSRCPVGKWARLQGMYPASVDTSRVLSPDLMFIETNEYVVEEDQIYPNQDWSLGEIRDG